MTGDEWQEAQRKSPRLKDEAGQARAIQRAVANVLDGTCNMTEAAKGQGLPVGVVREAVKAAREAKR